MSEQEIYQEDLKTDIIDLYIELDIDPDLALLNAMNESQLEKVLIELERRVG